jgi:chemotaxis protein histidine kinase CheA
MMDTTDIIRLLNADHYSPANLEEVNDLCRNYPMFNVGHLLKLRILEALGHPLEDELRLAAVYSSDRVRLLQLIREVVREAPTEEEQGMEEKETAPIEFAEESNQEADVIIVQHAPYAAPLQEQDLLELDEEGQEEQEEEEKGEREKEEEEQAASEEKSPEEEEAQAASEEKSPDEEEEQAASEEESAEEEEELTSENLIKAVVKDEKDMEEPDVPEIPQVDVVEQGIRESENKNLIEQFIRGDAGPIRAAAEITLKGDVSKASIREHDGFITDTLAKIYVKQGLYAKAIYAYEKLSLKYPEKSAYFAAQIEKIKNINQS